MERKKSKRRKNTEKHSRHISATEQLKACYVYGLIDTGRKLAVRAKPIGYCGKVYTIRYRDIAALVSDTDFKEYDPTEENLLAHNRIVQEAFDELGCNVLPLRFSTVAKTPEDVIRILSAGYFEFKKRLSSLEGKVEIVIKVFCDVQQLEREVARKTNLKSPDAIRMKMSEKTYSLASKLLEPLKAVATQSRLNDIVFEDMIMNSAFLVKKDRVQEFFEEIKSFDKQYGEHLRIRCSGPYAPYSFTESLGNQTD